MTVWQIVGIVLALVEVVMRALGYKEADIGDILRGVQAKMPDELEKLQRAKRPDKEALADELELELGAREPRRDAGGFTAPDPAQEIVESPHDAPRTLRSEEMP